MMMIAPVDSQEDKTQEITEENGNHWAQGCHVSSTWRAHLQHHHCNDDGNYTITERFHSGRGHDAGPTPYYLLLTAAASTDTLDFFADCPGLDRLIQSGGRGGGRLQRGHRTPQ